MPKTRPVSSIGCKSVDFVMPTGGSFPRDFTITLAGGPGLTPKAVIIELSGATTLDTIQATARLSVGIWDGTTARCLAVVAEDGAIGSVNANSGYRVDTGSVIQMPTNSGNGALQVSATPVSFGVDSVTINVDVDAGAFRGVAKFFYGADLRANVVSLAGNASIGGTTATTAPGWKPGFVFGWSVGQAFAALGSGTGGMFSHGFAVRNPSVLQACSSVIWENAAVTTTSSGCISRNNAIVELLTSSVGTKAESAWHELSFDATGFTITTRNAAVSFEAMFLSLDLAQTPCWAGVPTLVASGAGAHSDTNPAMRPQAMFFSGAVVAAANTLGSTRGSLSVGMVTATESACTALLGQDNQTTSVAKSLISVTNFIDLPLTAATHDWIAAETALTRTGFDYNVSDTAAADRPTPMAVIGNPFDPGWWPVLRRWRRQLARM